MQRSDWFKWSHLNFIHRQLFSSFLDSPWDFVGFLPVFLLFLFLQSKLGVLLLWCFYFLELSLPTHSVFLHLHYINNKPNLFLKLLNIYFPFLWRTALFPLIVRISRLKNSPSTSVILWFSMYSDRIFAPNYDILLFNERIWFPI